MATAPATPPHDGSDGAADDVQLPAGLALDLGGQLSFKLEGTKLRPTSATLRITGGKVDVDGQFQLGDVVAVRVELVVGAVGFVDKHDAKTGQVTGTERQHKARVVGIAVVE